MSDGYEQMDTVDDKNAIQRHLKGYVSIEGPTDGKGDLVHLMSSWYESARFD